MKRTLRAFAGLALLLSVACSSPKEDSVALGAPESFRWTSSDIQFAVPPTEWERQREQDGGWVGVRYLGEGGWLTVAEQSSVARRDRRETLRELLAELDSLSERELLRKLQLARFLESDPTSAEELNLARRANHALSEIPQYAPVDRSLVRSALQQAIRYADQVEIELPQVIAAVRQPEERFGGLGKVSSSALETTTVGGRPAKSVEYQFSAANGDYVGQDVYVVNDNHLYIASCYTREPRDLKVFEQLLATISFPVAGSH